MICSAKTDSAKPIMSTLGMLEGKPFRSNFVALITYTGGLIRHLAVKSRMTESVIPVTGYNATNSWHSTDNERLHRFAHPVHTR